MFMFCYFVIKLPNMLSSTNSLNLRSSLLTLCLFFVGTIYGILFDLSLVSLAVYSPGCIFLGIVWFISIIADFLIGISQSPSV